MVGCRAHCAGEKCTSRKEEGEQCGPLQCVTLGYLLDETYSEG